MKISYNRYPGGLKKALTMSYDDGQIHDRRLVEIFNQYGIKGTFHLNAGSLGRDNILKATEIKALFKGHEVSAHTYTHPFLTTLPKEVVLHEVREDRKSLEELTGCMVRGMSYPFGDYDESILKALPVLGIEYARTTLSHGKFTIPGDFLQWHPTCHHNSNLKDKWIEFQNVKSWLSLPLLYIWGHSYEFDTDNNWTMIEEFCKKASEDSRVWYATNVEVMDYIVALRNLKVSVDQKMIFNPSAQSVWVGVDEESLEIQSGETIAIG